MTIQQKLMNLVMVLLIAVTIIATGLLYGVKDLHAIAADMGNVLESVTIPNYPVIAQIKEKMLESGAINSLMSGSGPTVFGLFEDEKTAKKAAENVRRSGLAKQIYVTSIYNNRAE